MDPLPLIRAARRWRWPVLLFVGLPAVLTIVLTATGHPPMVGDDPSQNFPLRVLAGLQIRHGHLPLWNPYLWGGTPLLAGSNGGSLYPGTLVFAVLPATWAWALNVIAVYATAGLGMDRLLRDYGLRPAAALGGAAAFTYSGFLVGQLDHLPLIQGASLLPWLILGLRRLADRPRLVPVVAVLIALCILTGEPRAITFAVVVLGFAAIDVAVRSAHRVRYLSTVALAGALGLMLATVYWLPALHWTDASQRGHPGFDFFSSGSLQPTWLLLLGVPFLMGAASRLWPGYLGTYGLSEISSYAGLFAVIAVPALLPRLVRRPREHRYWLWFAFVLAGALLAIGGFTPLGHLLVRIPYYGGQRLQSRNLGLLDLGLAGLVGFWLERRLAAGRAASPALAVPAVLAGGLTVWALSAPGSLASALAISRDDFRRELLYLLLTVGLALAAGLIAWRGGGRLVVGFLVADLLFAAGGQAIVGPASAELSGRSALGRAMAAALPSGTRFAIYDPGQLHLDALRQLGDPDVNVLRKLPSVQGYGSVVAAGFDAATGTHLRGSLRPGALVDGTFDALDLDLLLAPAPAFLGGPATPSLVGERFLGPPLTVTSVHVAVDPGTRLPRVGLVDPAGVMHSAAGPVSAVAVTLTPPTVAVVSITAGGVTQVVNGPLAAATDGPRWTYAGTLGPYASLRQKIIPPRTWLVSAPGGRITGGDPLTVTAPAGGTLVRSVTWTPGWTARLASGGRSRTVPVIPNGVVQGARLPPGTWTVSYRYRPSDVTEGGWVSLAGLVLVVLLVVWRRPGWVPGWVPGGLSWARRRPGRVS